MDNFSSLVGFTNYTTFHFKNVTNTLIEENISFAATQDRFRLVKGLYEYSINHRLPFYSSDVSYSISIALDLRMEFQKTTKKQATLEVTTGEQYMFVSMTSFVHVALSFSRGCR